MKRFILLAFTILTLFTCDNRSYKADVAQLIYEFIDSTKTGHALRKTFCIMEYSAMYDIEPEILMRLGYAESTFRHWLVNDYSKCVGMFQISQYHWQYLAWKVQEGKYAKYLNKHEGTNTVKVLKYLAVNTEIACIILRTYLDAYDEDYEKTLEVYGGWRTKYGKKYPERKKKYIAKVLGH
jgi:hypothetical protein